jgi:hypothetical protein
VTEHTQPDPTAAIPPADIAARVEHDTRREGRTMLAAGLTLAGLTVVTALTCRFIAHELFPYEITNLLYFVAAVFTVCGLYERADRRRRAGIRYAIEAQEKNIAVNQQHGDTLVKVLDRLDAMERTVAALPDYGQGVIDGVQMRQSAVGDRD